MIQGVFPHDSISYEPNEPSLLYEYLALSRVATLYDLLNSYREHSSKRC